MNVLRASRHEIQSLLERARALGLSRNASKRLQWFLYAREHDDNISLTCRYFGIARSTFLRWATRFDPKHPETLEEHSRSPHHVREPETDARTVHFIGECRKQNPMLGKEGVKTWLLEKYQLDVSSSTIGRVIARHGFFFAESRSHIQKRKERIDREDGEGSSPMESGDTHPTTHPMENETGGLASGPVPVFGS